MIQRPAFFICLTACLAIGTQSAAQQRLTSEVGSAIAQPFRDLSILRREPAEVLQAAASAPYAAPPTLPNGRTDCMNLDAEIISLDIALGPDVDAPRDPRRRSLTSQAMSSATNAIGDAIGDVVGLPYRGVIRRLSGAERRDRQAASATQAGIVRRAFLKGYRERDCADAQTFATIETPDMALAPTPVLMANAPETSATPTPVSAPAPALAHAEPSANQATLQNVADVQSAGG